METDTRIPSHDFEPDCPRDIAWPSSPPTARIAAVVAAVRNRGSLLLLATALAVGAWTGARAETEAPQTQTPEIETPEIEPAPVAPPAPMPVGNAEDGKRAYGVCAVCHLDDGAGRPDGVFPQLAGQHASVTYRQIADIRDEQRVNPIMCPFTRTLTNPQVIADLAKYLESLPLPLDNGKGPGTDYALGAKLYARDCANCHGERGHGDSEKPVPVIASQHYAYLTRQVGDIVDLHRCCSEPEMLEIFAGYSQREREAVADFVSRLEATQQLVPAPEAAPEQAKPRDGSGE